jgi:triosephosphate isomerase
MADRSFTIVANWKSALGIAESRELAAAVAAHRRGARVAVTLAPSFPAIPAVIEAVAKSTVAVGAQDASPDDPGAHTGEVTLEQLRELGVGSVILGHSERRSRGVTDALVARVLTAALRAGIVPILCVGETAEERRTNHHVDVVRAQITAALGRVRPPFGGTAVLLAYEPVWAIGTGVPIDGGQAVEMLAVVQQCIVDQVAPPFRSTFRFLYGGSVDAANLPTFVGSGRFDGALVGTASWQAELFLPLLDTCATL